MKNNLLRIIGGEWRSRKLRFADVAGLRPTPDRVRETLFNWLQTQVPGARCLDLFAGSGALGLEALSRGAGEVVMVEKHPAAARLLRENITLLGAQNALLLHDDAFRYLQRETVGFDLIFLDPPFRQNLLVPVLEAIVDKGLLKTGGMIYLEQEADTTIDFERFNLTIHRATKAGQVQSLLLI
ncbi:MAG: rRNA ((966)-N(2))-methyltransferase RsmD [Pseudomonadota bacterium]|jgi:16S rRNA (guanine966-N2)-methyltransferase|uniref:Ribosomal RNA small subunit methyltransferase D n=1 Tax=Thiothrix fructosivorans TaxID=111770 RepID=A0A8B0SJQ6_9GAMM|nr:16S rRNA (guanine(966)-N(2))-methyltransferase RsmD [Thiothrix fructosivorans]MBO0614379.1 16S rRNA (guanine(966)-N(2))-methyltransferase RsmD [Thiothrix fructosivorans]QTX09222.1 16S rRNA (guanine(966)-N(2))-methyltransferase RsmD [Thiothrix fructosivorans]